MNELNVLNCWTIALKLNILYKSALLDWIQKFAAFFIQEIF